MLNKNFINKKVRLIQKDIGKLEDFKDMSVDEIVSDYFKMFTLERLFERIINRAIDINQHIISELGKGYEDIKGYEDTFYTVAEIGVYPEKFAKQIAKSAGLRNRIVHEYDELDYRKIKKSIPDALKDYTKYCDYILKFAEKTA